jgi:hypothetical protein
MLLLEKDTLLILLQVRLQLLYQLHQSIGDTISIKDYAGTFATNKLTIDRNGKNIQGVANNSQISTKLELLLY